MLLPRIRSSMLMRHPRRVLLGAALVLLAAAIALGIAMGRLPREEPSAVVDKAADLPKPVSPPASPAPLALPPTPNRGGTLSSASMSNSTEPVADPSVALSGARSLEEAFRIYPRAEEFVRRYSQFVMQGTEVEQVRARFDYQLRMIHAVDDCMRGRVVAGFVIFTLYFNPVPAAPLEPVELKVDRIQVYNSNLSGDDSAVLIACLHSGVFGNTMPIKVEGYKKGFKFTIEIRWPLDQSDIYQFLATGDVPGYKTLW